MIVMIRSRPSLPLSASASAVVVTILSFVSSLSSILLVRAKSPYNVYNYDLTTPQFTPDGLLKQVEYACAAPSNSMPMVVLPLSIPTRNGNGVEHALVVATVSPPLRSDDDDTSRPTTSTTPIGSSGRGRRGQSRIVPIPLPSSSSSSRHPASVVVGLTGVLSDSVSLLRTARSSVSSHHSRYGAHPGAGTTPGDRGPSSVDAARRVAVSIANKCQEHAFGGGMRPFGASLAVCGLEEGGGNGGGVVVYVTDPSGALASYRYGRTGRGGGSVEQEDDDEGVPADGFDVVLIGGEGRSKAALRRRLIERLRSDVAAPGADLSDEDRYAETIRRSLRATVEALAHLPAAVGGGGGSLLGNKEATTVEGGGYDYDRVATQIDLVLVTSRAGVQRVSKEQIMELMMAEDRSNDDETFGQRLK